MRGSSSHRGSLNDGRTRSEAKAANQRLRRINGDLPRQRDFPMHKGFLKAGHLPTLFAAFLYFDLSFMVWVLLGPLGVQISNDLGLTPAEKGLMAARPVRAGAILRIVNGLLVDHFGPKLVGAVAQALVIVG